LPGVRPDFELDEAANLGSIFLRGMLSEKEPAGLSNSYETLRQPSNGGDVFPSTFRVAKRRISWPEKGTVRTPTVVSDVSKLMV